MNLRQIAKTHKTPIKMLKSQANSAQLAVPAENVASFPLSPLGNCNALYISALSVFEKDLRHEKTLLPPTMTMQPKRYPHRKAIVCEPKKPGARWYIEYYIWNVSTEKLERKRKYDQFADCKNDQERRKIGHARCVKINALLQYSAISNHKIEPEKIKETRISVKSALDTIIKLKYPIEKNRKTHLTLNSICARFQIYCANSGIPTNNIKAIDKATAQMYIDFLASSGISPNTVENQFNAFRMLWNHLVKREYVDVNPWVGADRPATVESDRNEAYTLDEQKRIKTAIMRENPKVWRIVSLLYYCFIRESELARIRVKDVDLSAKQIHISGTNSKNKKRDFVTMPETVYKMFLEMDLAQYPGSYYLFTHELEPGLKPAYASAYYKKYRSALAQTDIKGKTLYSWKHTGVVAAYKAGVNIKAIQLQCRHSSIEQTDIYLKSLGLRDNDEFTTGIPEI